MDVELLQRVKAKILEEPPGHFDMAAFHSRCGTAHCIGGWASVLSGNAHGFGEELNLNPSQRKRLLIYSRWPAPFLVDYISRQKTRTTVVARRIDHFIATGGKE